MKILKLSELYADDECAFYNCVSSVLSILDNLKDGSGYFKDLRQEDVLVQAWFCIPYSC